jgi:hypothetical protein
MHKKNLHPNAANFQLKEVTKKKEKKEQDPRLAAGFAALTAGEFANEFFGFSHGSDDF